MQKPDELKEVTLNHLKQRDHGNGGQIVIVDFDNNGGRCLTFLVSDCEKPQVPGSPAVSLSYFDTVEEARNAIVNKYNELQYKPKHNCHLGSFS